MRPLFPEHCVEHFTWISPCHLNGALGGRDHYSPLLQMRKLGFRGDGKSSHTVPQGSTLSVRFNRVHSWPQHPPTPSLSGTHWGCSLYRVPSTPTVIFRCSSPWSSLLFSTMAAMPAPQSWAARRDTAPHTSFTTMLSSHVLSKPSCCRILLTWRRASRSLEGRRVLSREKQLRNNLYDHIADLIGKWGV